MEEEGSRGSEVIEHPEVEDVSAAESDADTDADVDADSDEWGDGTEGSGWFADPDVEGQERYYDGSEWTSETRSVEPDGPDLHLPDHAGELQRALAAATDDIDEVEDRLGNLFDRIEQRGERGGRAAEQKKDRQAAEAPADDDEDDDDEGEEWLLAADDRDPGDTAKGRQDLDGDADALAELDEDEEWLLDADDSDPGDARAAQDLDGDDDALAELDEALASEEPEKVKRGFFRRS